MCFRKLLAFMVLLSALEWAAFSQTNSGAKRLLVDPPLNVAYLTNNFVLTYQGTVSKPELSNALSQLKLHLSEMTVFVHDVEKGKIPVTTNHLQAAAHQSYLQQDDGWIVASYDSATGILMDFQKHQTQKPYALIYGFNFSTNGFLRWARSSGDFFKFDADGKVTDYSHH